jgi:UPF0755 protein
MPLFRKPAPPDTDRTPEQRAAERQARERRRAERAGHAFTPVDEPAHEEGPGDLPPLPPSAEPTPHWNGHDGAFESDYVAAGHEDYSPPAPEPPAASVWEHETTPPVPANEQEPTGAAEQHLAVEPAPQAGWFDVPTSPAAEPQPAAAGTRESAAPSSVAAADPTSAPHAPAESTAPAPAPPDFAPAPPPPDFAAPPGPAVGPGPPDGPEASAPSPPPTDPDAGHEYPPEQASEPQPLADEHQQHTLPPSVASSIDAGGLAESQAHTYASEGPEEPGPEEPGPEEPGLAEHGPEEPGPAEHGPEAYGPAEHGPEAYGPAAHGPGPVAHPQDTFEHVALAPEPGEPPEGWPGRGPAATLPEMAEIEDLPPSPARRTPAGGGGRIPPPPTRRDALLERRARRLDRHRGEARTSRSLLRPGRILALLGLSLVVALLWFSFSLFQPLKGSGHGQVVVVIPHGTGARGIGTLLASRGVVASGFFFDLRAAVDGERGQLHSGVYTFKRDMSYAAAIAELAKPPPPPPVVRVLVAEGEPRTTIARVARDDGLAGDYLQASRRSPALDPTTYGAPRTTPSLEGFLYPATYDLKAGTDATGLVTGQLTAFKSHFGPAQAPAARALHVTLYDLLIVASMVEREALLSRDRPLVAAVIYNRLRQHIPLGIDATIRYALSNWSSPLTLSDLRINSPYNTRTHVGLPPTPIGNPGLASINAATHPARVPYLYYVDGSDGCGDLKFSSSFAQFQSDSSAYQAALAHNGGRVPSCKK